MEIQNILGYKLNTSARFIKRKMDKNLEIYNLTTSQLGVIRLLSKKGQLIQAQIAVSEIDLIAKRVTQEALSGIEGEGMIFYKVLEQIINNLIKGEENSDLEARDT